MSNINQQVFLLSLASNSIRKEKGTTAQLVVIAKEKIDFYVTLLGWNVVWGPAVWKTDPSNSTTGPDHVWFVAKTEIAGELLYVISIAATATIYNHLVNNADVVQVVDFTAWPPGERPIPTPGVQDTGTHVAFGTALGTYTLSSQPAPAAPGAGLTLPAFLKAAPRASVTKFIFTGFSLGGALSPTVALRLVKQVPAIFQTTDKVLTYPIAGASPGNVQFAKCFADAFPLTVDGSKVYQVWNTNIANMLDVVPHAWSTNSSQVLRLDKIPNLYGNKDIEGIHQKVSIAIAAANKSGIQYIPLQFTPFSGPSSPPPTTEQQFLEIAKKQHTTAYVQLFDTSLLIDGDLENLFPEPVIGV